MRQLLNAAAENGKRDEFRCGASDHWDSKDAAALKAFQTSALDRGIAIRPFLDPRDNCLLEIAKVARCVMPMPGRRGLDAMRALHDQCETFPVHYNQGYKNPDLGRSVWALKHWPGWAVSKPKDGFAGGFYTACVGYANVLLSVFQTGDIRAGSYDPHTNSADYGFLPKRYNVKDRVLNTAGGASAAVKGFSTAEQIREALKERSNDSVYILQKARQENAPDDAVPGAGEDSISRHIAVMFGTAQFGFTVMEASQVKERCIHKPLWTWMRDAKIGRGDYWAYLYGPVGPAS